MKYLIPILIILGLGGWYLSTNTNVLGAQSALTTFQGGTGSTSPSGILYGDSTIRLKTATIGSGLTFSGGTLSSTGAISGGTAGMLTSWLSDTTLTATNTPTFASFVSTSTATSTMVGGLLLNRFHISATSTGSKGIDITAGCFAVNGTCIGGGTPGGSDTQVQFNDGGVFGGDAGMIYDKTTDVFTLSTVSNYLEILKLISTDTAEGGPTITFFSNSASPAADDTPGQIYFSANDSGGNVNIYAQIYSAIRSTIDGREQGELILNVDANNGGLNLILYGNSTTTTISGLGTTTLSIAPSGNGATTRGGLIAIDDMDGQGQTSLTVNNGFLHSNSFYASTSVLIGTTTSPNKLHVSNGASATTTVSIGELGLSTSKSCVNMNTSAGGAASFYINTAGTMIVETNYCR